MQLCNRSNSRSCVSCPGVVVWSGRELGNGSITMPTPTPPHHYRLSSTFLLSHLVSLLTALSSHTARQHENVEWRSAEGSSGQQSTIRQDHSLSSSRLSSPLSHTLHLHVLSYLKVCPLPTTRYRRREPRDTTLPFCSMLAHVHANWHDASSLFTNKYRLILSPLTFFFLKHTHTHTHTLVIYTLLLHQLFPTSLSFLLFTMWLFVFINYCQLLLRLFILDDNNCSFEEEASLFMSQRFIPLQLLFVFLRQTPTFAFVLLMILR